MVGVVECAIVLVTESCEIVCHNLNPRMVGIRHFQLEFVGLCGFDG